MRAVYSKDIVEAIKSRPKGQCVLYDSILFVAEAETEDARSWQEVYPDIMTLYKSNHKAIYKLEGRGFFNAAEIIVLLGRVDLLRAMLSPTSEVIACINTYRSNMMSCAAWCDNVEIFKLCFNRFAPFFAPHMHDSLVYALRNHNMEILNAACEANVKIFSSQVLSRSVNIAYSKGNIDIIKLMISKFNVRYALSLALDNAAINNDVSFFRELHDESKPLDSIRMFSEEKVLDVKLDLGVTPIATAAFMGSWDVVRFLFALGVPLYNNVGRRNYVYYSDTILHTIYNCHLPQDVEGQKPLISDIYYKLKSSLSPSEQTFFVQHFCIESKACTH